MKVVHISSSMSGGAGRAAYSLHKALLEHNVDSKFISIKNTLTNDKQNEINISCPQPSFLARFTNKLGLPITNSHKIFKTKKNLKKGKYEIISFPLTDFKVEDFPELQNADIIHLHWVADFINYPRFFQKLKHKKIIWTLHDMSPIMGVFHYENDLKYNISNFHDVETHMFNIKVKSISQADNLSFICLCKWMEDEVKKRDAFRKIPLKTIPNIISKIEFKALPKQEARIQLNIEDSKINLLFIAHNISTVRKGGDLLIEALKLVKNKEKYRLLIVGNGELPIDLGIEKKTFNHIISSEELSTIYSAADALILPSREDNLPNTMVEAMLCGTPILSFNIGGMKSHIKHGFNGFLVTPFDTYQLSEIINTLPNTVQEFDPLLIRNYAIQNFSDSITKDYLEFYQSI